MLLINKYKQYLHAQQVNNPDRSVNFLLASYTHVLHRTVFSAPCLVTRCLYREVGSVVTSHPFLLSIDLRKVEFLSCEFILVNDKIFQQLAFGKKGVALKILFCQF